MAVDGGDLLYDSDELSSTTTARSRRSVQTEAASVGGLATDVLTDPVEPAGLRTALLGGSVTSEAADIAA
eukprot:20560-Heterococcus_DN1.PRE.3